MIDNRKKMKADHPDKDFGEISKLVGEQWKQMSAEAKQPYEAKAVADKQVQPPPSLWPLCLGSVSAHAHYLCRGAHSDTRRR